jgi:hypothetical protein
MDGGDIRNLEPRIDVVYPAIEDLHFDVSFGVAFPRERIQAAAPRAGAIALETEKHQN